MDADEFDVAIGGSGGFAGVGLQKKLKVVVQDAGDNGDVGLAVVEGDGLRVNGVAGS